MKTTKYIVPIIAVVMFLLLIFSATYAYFTSTVTLNNANYQITMPSTTSLICTKTDCNATITPAMMSNANTNATTAKATSNCSVSCTCSGTPGATCNYNVSLIEKGDSYYPSASLGNEKEFTVQITNQTGCTIQNSSSTITQVNNMYDKVVANCSLTVPQGGSVTSNVSAEFKWYNLNLDQSAQANNSYEYELSTSKQVIYRTGINEFSWAGTSLITRSGWCASADNNGYQLDSCLIYNLVFDTEVECQGMIAYAGLTGTCYQGSVNGLTNYVTNRNSINQSYYLKHTVEDNKITDSYACIKYTEDGISKEACVQGGDPSYYGTYDGMTDVLVNSVTGAIGNIKKIQNTQSYMMSTNGYCRYGSVDSGCNNGSSLYFRANAYGNVNVGIGNNKTCYVNGNGIAGCEQY